MANKLTGKTEAEKLQNALRPMITELLRKESGSLKQWVEDRFEKQEVLLEKSQQLQTKQLEQFVSEEIKTSEKRTKYHFDVVAENIHKDVAGANKDKVSMLENRKDDHEQRITVLEQTAGLR